MRETWVWFLGRQDPLEKEMAIHSSTLAWKIPWMEAPDRLQSMGFQRVGHDWVTSLSLSLYAEYFTSWQVGGFPFYRWGNWGSEQGESCAPGVHRRTPSSQRGHTVSVCMAEALLPPRPSGGPRGSPRYRFLGPTPYPKPFLFWEGTRDSVVTMCPQGSWGSQAGIQELRPSFLLSRPVTHNPRRWVEGGLWPSLSVLWMRKLRLRERVIRSGSWNWEMGFKP